MFSITEILAHVEAEHLPHRYEGDPSLRIQAYSTLKQRRSHSILWIKDASQYDLAGLAGLEGLLVVTSDPIPGLVANFLYSPENKAVFFSILRRCFGAASRPGIHPTAVVETKAIGKNVQIGALAYIGPEVQLGDNCIIQEHVTLRGRIRIGDDCHLLPGVVMGTDGFGTFEDAQGVQQMVEHFGGIQLGDRVYIGAHTCIDRGTLDDTMIGNDVKIDNLCHIAHNVVIEDNSTVIALSMIAGSSVLKKKSYIAPSASVMNNLTVGQNALVGMGAVVVKDVPENSVVAGVPAKVIRQRKPS